MPFLRPKNLAAEPLFVAIGLPIVFENRTADAKPVGKWKILGQL